MCRRIQTPSPGIWCGLFFTGGHQNPGLAYGPFWVGLECVSVYPEASARDQREGIRPGLLGEESPSG